MFNASPVMEIHELVALERSLGMAPLSSNARRELVEMCSRSFESALSFSMPVPVIDR